MAFAERKSLRLKHWDYSSPGMYFVTFCTFDRKCILGSILEETLGRDDAICSLARYGEVCQRMAIQSFEGGQGVALDSVVIMPNHVHALIVLSGDNNSEETLGRSVSRWKALTTKEARRVGFEGKLWQPGFHDHIVRGEADLARIREYMQNNPKKWALDKYYCK